jgi:hypothetical protein
VRNNLQPPVGVRKWTKKYREWLDTLKFESSSFRVVFQEYYHQLKELGQRILRLEAEIKLQATEGVHAPTIKHNLFKWKHYQPDIILLTVRWYLLYNLSFFVILWK